MYTSGTCAAGYASFAPGSRLVYRLGLGDGVPLGGLLTLSTCGRTANNTVLYLGTGCPTTATSFNCVRGNDDAGDALGQSCGANARASSLSHLAASRVYFVQVGAASGAPVVSGLAWSYVLPTASASATASRSRSRTASATRSRSATTSKSRSRKAKRAA